MISWVPQVLHMTHPVRIKVEENLQTNNIVAATHAWAERKHKQATEERLWYALISKKSVF